jgi:hypothetical protein
MIPAAVSAAERKLDIVVSPDRRIQKVAWPVVLTA